MTLTPQFLETDTNTQMDKERNYVGLNTVTTKDRHKTRKIDTQS